MDARLLVGVVPDRYHVDNGKDMMADFAWLQWAIPAGVFLAGLIAHWGINETRVRGQQHQIDALREQVNTLAEAYKTLGRLDERTLNQGRQLERIENKLNGK